MITAFHCKLCLLKLDLRFKRNLHFLKCIHAPFIPWSCRVWSSPPLHLTAKNPNFLMSKRNKMFNCRFSRGCIINAHTRKIWKFQCFRAVCYQYARDIDFCKTLSEILQVTSQKENSKWLPLAAHLQCLFHLMVIFANIIKQARIILLFYLPL